jgi:hypothetical protein
MPVAGAELQLRVQLLEASMLQLGKQVARMHHMLFMQLTQVSL